MINIGNRVVNTYLYPIGQRYIMIDTGYQNSFNRCMKKLKKKNIRAKDVAFIFLTHAHDDHAGFINDMINANNNIKVIMSNKGIDTLRKGQNSFDGGCSGKQSYLFCFLMKMLGKGQHRFPPIKKEYEKNLLFATYENKPEIEQMLDCNIIETPGHTDDSISLLTKEGYLFCGDAAMSGFPSRNNIIIWITSKTEFIKSWREIIKLNPKKVYPAHGKPFETQQLEKNIARIQRIELLPLSP